MENEIAITEVETTSDIIKDAAIKAIAGAIIGFAVTETLKYSKKKFAARLAAKKSAPIEATATEV